jgi:hypothetical protein
MFVLQHSLLDTDVYETCWCLCFRPFSKRPLDGTQALAEVVSWCHSKHKLQMPQRLKARGLRKYLATVCQVSRKKLLFFCTAIFDKINTGQLHICR